MNKITIERAVLEQALEALEKPSNLVIRSLSVNEAIRSLRNALAQPHPRQQEPALKVYKGEICYKSKDDDQSYGMWCPVTHDYQHGLPDGAQFYTSPQAQPLSDEQARFQAQQQFLQWNRKQETPLVAVAHEYSVFRKAVDLYIDADNGITKGTT